MTETTELYGGEVVCEFEPNKHTYTIVIKGRRYKVPSVTRITSIIDKSGPLMAWAVNSTLDVCKGAIAPGTEYAESYLDAVWMAAKQESRSRKEQAADRGKLRHAEIESAIKRGEAATVLVGTQFEKFKFREVERRIYSRRHRYSGTFDAIAETPEGQLVLLDWKTSKSIYPEFRLQTAAYVAAYEEEFPNQCITGRYLVRIGEDGAIEPHYFPSTAQRRDFQAFLGARKLYEEIQRIEKENRKSLKTKDILV